MKVIDLLNKIANGEEVPKKFEVNGRIWEWNVHSYNCELHSEFAVTGLRYDLSNLNDEIKILDIEYLNNDLRNKLIKPFIEPQEYIIPKKLEYYKSDDDSLIGLRETINVMYDDTTRKINQIIDYLEENK